MLALGLKGMRADQNKWAREGKQPELNLEGNVADRNIMLRSKIKQLEAPQDPAADTERNIMLRPKIKQPAPGSPDSNALLIN